MKLANVTLLLVLLFVILVFGPTMSAEALRQSMTSAPATVPDVPRPNPSGSNPKPEDATTAILAAFGKYEIVGMSAAHGNKDLDDFILDLVRNPAFPGNVDDVAVECGNSLYQPILARPLHCRRRRITVRRAESLAQYYSDDVWPVELL